MTVMDPRPWSPAGPHIGPDDDDLAMLDPTGDPEVDLGSVVLAAHRVGAAAAEAVARAPLPDEFRLVDALATARAAFAAPAVDAISKCVSSDNPRGYADLLLRDLFDAGEQGALAVYRACVSKGVAPPLAVQRAGLVYGVPHNELGRYMSVAADTKTHPVALADAADRAVTAWASGVVREEMSTTVSKQTLAQESVQQYNTTSFGQEHPKDRRGRFAEVLERPAPVTTPVAGEVAGRPAGFLARMRRDTGVGEQAAPEVATEPAPTVTAATIVAPRRPRVQRRQRVQRVQRTEASAQAPAQVHATVRAQLRGQSKAAMGARMRARLDAQRNAPTGEPGLNDVDDDFAVSDEFTEKLGARVLAWAMPVNRANEIYNEATGGGTPEKPKFARMGKLQQLLAEPLPWAEQHKRSLRNRAEEAADLDGPRFVRISAGELEANGVSTYGDPKKVAEDVEDHAKLAGYYDQLAHDRDGTYNPLLKGSMSAVKDADGHDWFIVLNPEPLVYGHSEGQDIPAAAEFVMVDDSENTARVHVGGSPSNPSYELDPTQAWIIHEPNEVWRVVEEPTEDSPGSGYWIDRYTLRPLDEFNNPYAKRDSVGKATATMVRERWRTEPRNELGEWTGGGFLARVKTEPEPTKVVTPVVTPIAAKPRIQRKQRSQRRQQVQAAEQATSTAEVTAESTGQLKARLPARMLAAFHAGLKEDEPQEVVDTNMPAWDDRDRYVVFSADEWDHLLRQNGYQGYRNEVVPKLPLSSSARQNLLQRKPVDGVSADTETRMHVEDEITEKHMDERREIRALRFHVDDDDDIQAAAAKWTEIGKKIRNMMAVDQTIQSVRIDPGVRWGDYRVMVNARPASDVVVVVMPDDYDPGKPFTLEFSGRARQSALNRNVGRSYDEALHVDAPVQMFRVTQGMKAIWHARQDEQ